MWTKCQVHTVACMNLAGLPDRRAQHDPHGPCVADDDTQMTNTQFRQAVADAALTLRAHGVTAGDVVAIMLPNTASLVVALFAAWRVGAAATPLNPNLAPAEVAYQVADASAKVLIVEKSLDFEVSSPSVLPASALTSQPSRVDEPAPVT